MAKDSIAGWGWGGNLFCVLINHTRLKAHFASFTVSLYNLPCALHLARQSAEPIAAPVPTAGMVEPTVVLLRIELPPKAAATMSGGSWNNAFARLVVPASSELSAEMRVALLQPGAVS
jgi:hypothetical protein